MTTRTYLTLKSRIKTMSMEDMVVLRDKLREHPKDAEAWDLRFQIIREMSTRFGVVT